MQRSRSRAITVSAWRSQNVDLTDWSACVVEFAENYRRQVPSASRRSAGTHVTASPDLNGGRSLVEVGLEHGFGLPRVCARTNPS